MPLKADKPIKTPKEDVLGRAEVAVSFAKQLLSLDISEGVVVGVLGPWGSGKTSFVNLVRGYLENLRVPVLDFNPWMFSGTEQLIDSFFIELSTQLKLNSTLHEIGKALKSYGEIFSGLGSLPFVGPLIEGSSKVSKTLAKILQRREEGITSSRVKVEKALATLDKPIVVIIDDIDRLTVSEIQDIFKLVRLTANFPNVIYILAFDRLRVEQALTEQGLPGRDYLEKILQISVDLPAIPNQILNRHISQAINEAIDGIKNPGPFQKERWPDVFMEIIRPLFKNIRDVRRYALAVHGTVLNLNGQVALVDVLALEAIRVFLPDVFYQIHESIDGLTETSEITLDTYENQSPLKEQIDKLIETAGNKANVVRALITRIFPAAERHIGGLRYGDEWKKRWLQERRVAHEHILRFYLERLPSKGLQAFVDAERAFEKMADLEEFNHYLRSLDPSRLEDVIASLEVFEDRFRAEHVVPGVVVLLNILPEIPERPLGMFDLGPELIVSRVVYRLIRSLQDHSRVEEAVRNIIRHLNTLYAKELLITMVGYQEGAGHKLVSKKAAENFEKEWRDEVRSASISTLIKEKGLLRILLLVKRGAGPEEPPLGIPDSPFMTLALLQSAQVEVYSQSMGSRFVRPSVRLAWDELVELYGNEDVLRDRIEKLKSTHPEGADELLSLVDKYLAGWRPSDSGRN